MLENLLIVIVCPIVLAVLFASVIGAWRHAVAQTLGDPLWVNPSPKTKGERNFALLGKVLWHVAAPVVMVGGIFLEFAAELAEHDGSEETEIDSNDDFRYKHDGERYYTHSTPGEGKSSWY